MYIKWKFHHYYSGHFWISEKKSSWQIWKTRGGTTKGGVLLMKPCDRERTVFLEQSKFKSLSRVHAKSATESAVGLCGRKMTLRKWRFAQKQFLICIPKPTAKTPRSWWVHRKNIFELCETQRSFYSGKWMKSFVLLISFHGEIFVVFIWNLEWSVSIFEGFHLEILSKIIYF